jgi:hypothetical protein
MPSRDELIAKAQAKWQREQLVSQAQAKWQAENAAPNGPSENLSATRGAISGVTAGFDDEITGVVGAAGRVAGVKNLGSWKPLDPDSRLEFDGPTLNPEEIVQAYRENRDAIRAEQKQDMATNPKATLAGNVAGSFISPAAKLKAAGAGMKPLMKTAAMQGAAFSAGTSDADLTSGEVGELAKDVATGTALSAAVPPALKLGGYVAGKGADLAKWAGKKSFSATFGIRGDAVSKYLANPERINSAKTVEEIKGAIDETVGRLSDAVDNGRATETEAKEALRSLHEQVTRGLSDAKGDARDALRAAQASLESARERVLAPLKAKTAPTQFASDASEMVGALKDRVRGKSGAALETLKDSGQTVGLRPIYDHIDDSIARLRAENTDEALSVVDKLEKYRARLQNDYSLTASADEAKRLIQGIDKITEYSPMLGSFDKAKNLAFKGVRARLDDSLKENVPAYRSQMAELAPEAKLLDEANAAFGSPEVAVGKLGRLNTPRGEFDRATLAQLELAVGKPGMITREADEFAKAQRILKNPQALRQIEQSLPEYQMLRRAQADVARRNPRWTRQQVEQATTKQRRTLAEAVGRRIFAQNRYAPFRGLAPGSTESRIRSVMRPRGSVESRKMLERLGKETGQDFVQMAEDRAVLESFDKGAGQGAANTLFWGILGLATGGIPGALGGAAFGRQVIDAYGPKVGKALLDGVVKIRKNPSVQTIRKMTELPPNIRAELEREFRVYVSMRNAGEGGVASKVASGGDGADRAPSGRDRWARDGLEKLGISGDRAARLLRNQKMRDLVEEASSLTPGSKRFRAIKEQIEKGGAK